MTTTSKMPKFVKMLLAEGGATSKELQAAMNRVWAPTAYQLRPIAKRNACTLRRIRVAGQPIRYQFTPRKVRTVNA